jgi:hypothetical protein
MTPGGAYDELSLVPAALDAVTVNESAEALARPVRVAWLAPPPTVTVPLSGAAVTV